MSRVLAREAELYDAELRLGRTLRRAEWGPRATWHFQADQSYFSSRTSMRSRRTSVASVDFGAGVTPHRESRMSMMHILKQPAAQAVVKDYHKAMHGVAQRLHDAGIDCELQVRHQRCSIALMSCQPTNFLHLEHFNRRRRSTAHTFDVVTGNGASITRCAHATSVLWRSRDKQHNWLNLWHGTSWLTSGTSSTRPYSICTMMVGRRQSSTHIIFHSTDKMAFTKPEYIQAVFHIKPPPGIQVCERLRLPLTRQLRCIYF